VCRAPAANVKPKYRKSGRVAATTHKKATRSPGGPQANPRTKAADAALSLAIALNPDAPVPCDPRAILRAIASDASQPAAARVAAAKALIADSKPTGDPVKARADTISERALKLMGRPAPDADRRPN
jgi:hypothetical protein